MLRFFRRPALPAPYAERLLGILKEGIAPQATRLLAEWCFYVESGEALSPLELERLRWLLAETFEPENFGTGSFVSDCATVLEVGPRLNFETAFSTTAVAICRACGLSGVRRVERSIRYGIDAHLDDAAGDQFLQPLHDRMTQMRYREPLTSFAVALKPEPVRVIPLLSRDWRENLRQFSQERGIGWDDQDLEFLCWLFQDTLKRNATDGELFHLGQANAEHSRHWRFKGVSVIDGIRMPRSLMQLIRAPLEADRRNSVIAFADDSSAILGGETLVLLPADSTRPSPFVIERRILHPTLTAETHNHPIMHEPYQGAMTKVGGLFRDQIVVGRGGRIGISGVGFAVGNLHIPGWVMPWEEGDWPPPPEIATPLQVALRGSDGDFDYGNCFGQPVIFGFFRTFGMRLADGSYRAWFKPVGYGVAGGAVDDAHVRKGSPERGMLVGLVGGPAYRIGIGGGSASSMIGGENAGELDFASVQRGDPEMENRLNRFMLACVEQREANPIVAAHDLGAGGLCNAASEIADPAGAEILLQAIPSGDPSLSALEIHGNEAQERNIVLVASGDRAKAEAIAEREGAPLAFIGRITGDGRYVLRDQLTGETPVDLPLREILGNLPPKTFSDQRVQPQLVPLCLPAGLTVREALDRVFRLPVVGSKEWLTRKVDRSVTGLVAQQQCVGPHHLPVADFAVKADSYFGLTGTAYALGEQPIKGLISPRVMVRLAVAEALLNMAGARITDLADIKGEANWMLAAKLPGEFAWLYDAAEAVSGFWRELGIAADGGKDSLSMAVRTKSPAGENAVVASPGEFVFAAYAPMPDVTCKVTPVLRPDEALLFMDLGCGENRLGGSALAQVFGQLGDAAPDVEAPILMRAFRAAQALVAKRLITAMHDRSDGGLVTTLLEMAFAGCTGLDIYLEGESPVISALFSEEPGLVVACERRRIREVREVLSRYDLAAAEIGAAVIPERGVIFRYNGEEVLRDELAVLKAMWGSIAARLDELQTDAECVRSEQLISYAFTKHPPYRLTFVPTATVVRRPEPKPKVAVIREQGSNGDREMAAAFTAVGFEAWDVTMRDIRSGAVTLGGFRGLALVGGFAFADVFDSAKGWAGAILFNDRVHEQFRRFRERPDTFALGVCNGCQLMALLGWVPGLEMTPEEQPRFIRNRSGRFESRFPSVRIGPSPAIMLKGMEGSTLGIWGDHGEGCFHTSSRAMLKVILARNLAPLRYVGYDNKPTEAYPLNPNGSPEGIAGLCSTDGRSLAIMPHPERTFLGWQWPWQPSEWESLAASPWLKLFQNAFEWCVAR